MTNNATLEKSSNKVINSYSKEQIINDLVKEVPQTAIAKQNNISQPRIHQIKKANQAIIDQKKQELIALLPSVVDTVKNDVNTNNRLSKHIALDFTKTTTEQIALKNSLDKTNLNLLRITGISPSQALINYNLTQDNRTQTTVISDNVLNLFSPHAKELIDTEVTTINGDTTNEDNSDNGDKQQ